ncbi:MAG TPA: thioredoxin family protein [Phycisphaerae bacterium]|nr:thioredoxin family protein [Phycisphaerae bacterium]
MRTRCMVRSLIILAAVAECGLVVGCGAVRWEYSYDKGMRQAMKQQRRALVEFVSTVSLDCHEMDTKVFTSTEVARLMQRYVAVRLDMAVHRDLARQFNVQTVPTFFVVRPDGQIMGSHVGKMDEEKFRAFLIKYAYN